MYGPTTYDYYVMTQTYIGGEKCVLLENGIVSMKAWLAGNVNFNTSELCLALVGHDEWGYRLEVFSSQVIAVSVDTQKVCSWLSGLDIDEYRESFANAVGIITHIKDFALRSCVINVFFDDALNPRNNKDERHLLALERLYSNMMGVGEFIHHYGDENHCSQRERDMYLTISILQLITSSDGLSAAYSNEHFQNIGELVEFQLGKLFSETCRDHYMNFYRSISSSYVNF